ncbi:hypothetical protein WJX77_004561 [Trebouxia sp. C0004]
MEASDLLLAGDDSSWNMSDWRWDSVGFLAVPKLAQQSTSSCCKKRKTSNCRASKRQPPPCGGCNFIEHGPLKLLQQASDSAGSNNFGDGADCKQQVTVHAASPAAKSSSAGPRPVTALLLRASSESTCQADGCKCDMGKQSVWHQKSRICDKHMSGIFLKQGTHQQFCQQCGRSHNPDAFDQGRRSCRTQLAKHAARRRKGSAAISTIDTPAPDYLSQVAGAAAATGCRAAVSIAALAMHNTSPDAWLQTLCDSQKAAEDQSLAQPFDAGHRHSSGGSEQSLAKHNLISPQIQPVSLEDIDSASLYQQSMLPMRTNSSEALSADGLASDCPQPISTSTWAGDNTVAPAHQVSDDPLQDLLSWQLPLLQESKPGPSSFDKAMSLMQNGTNTCYSASAYAPYQQQQQPGMQAAQVKPAPGYDAAPLRNWNSASVPYGLAGHTEVSSQTAAPASDSNLPQQAYSASTSAVRLSIKLFNCTPAQLPGSLRERVTGWLGGTPAGLEGYIRPGCVHLTVQATMPTRQAEGALTSTAPDVSIRSAVNHLLASPKQEVWHRCTMLVQLGDEAAVVHEGNPLKVWNIQGQAQAEQRHQNQQHEEQQQQQQHRQGGECGKAQRASCCPGPASLPNKLPVLSHAQAVCLVAGQRQQQQVTVFGHGLSADCKMLCRAGGNHLEVQMLRSSVTLEEAADMLQVALPGEVPAGLLYLEVQRGPFMGPALPVLVAPTPALAAEAAHMLQMTQSSDRQGLIVDLGCAMQYTAANWLLRSSSAEPAVSGMSVVQTLLPLVARAAQSGLDALVRHFMSVLAHHDMRAVATFRVQSGMGLLHLGVQSGNLAVLAALLEESNAELWQNALDGPGGISPFHLAVFLPEAHSVALLLSATLGASHWFCCTTHDGLTPADFAVRCSKDHLNHAIGASIWSQASAGKSLSQADREVDIKQQLFDPCVQQASADRQQTSVSTSSWSDSSSSAEDDSGSDVDASQHGGDRLSAMPAASCAMSPGLSAAAQFVQEKRERLAAVLRQVSWFQNPSAQ